jgi:hypothetical protein
LANGRDESIGDDIIASQLYKSIYAELGFFFGALVYKTQKKNKKTKNLKEEEEENRHLKIGAISVASSVVLPPPPSTRTCVCKTGWNYLFFFTSFLSL